MPVGTEEAGPKLARPELRAAVERAAPRPAGPTARRGLSAPAGRAATPPGTEAVGEAGAPTRTLRAEAAAVRVSQPRACGIPRPRQSTRAACRRSRSATPSRMRILMECRTPRTRVRISLTLRPRAIRGTDAQRI